MNRLKTVSFAGVAGLFALVTFWGGSERLGESHPLPLLPSGQHLGYIVGFNPDNPPFLQDVIEDCWRQARQRGMQTARVQMDWTDVEPEAGVMLPGELAERLAEFEEQGMPVFLLLTSADSDALNYPADLLAEDGGRFAEGMRPNDPRIIDRYNQMLQAVLPIARDYGVYCIAVGNEPDTHNEADPQFMNDFLDFVAAVREHAQSIAPEVAITYTSTVEPILSNTNYGHRIAEVVDVLCFNLYAQGGPGGFDQAATQAALEGILALDPHKPVLLQELGCSSAYLADKHFVFYESRPEIQATFLDWVFNQILAHPRVRAAYIFQLVENGPVVDAYWREALSVEELSEEWIDQMVESFDKLGLIEFETGEKKPGWHVFLDGLERFHAQRQSAIEDRALLD